MTWVAVRHDEPYGPTSWPPAQAPESPQPDGGRAGDRGLVPGGIPRRHRRPPASPPAPAGGASYPNQPPTVDRLAVRGLDGRRVQLKELPGFNWGTLRSIRSLRPARHRIARQQGLDILGQPARVSVQNTRGRESGEERGAIPGPLGNRIEPQGAKRNPPGVPRRRATGGGGRRTEGRQRLDGAATGEPASAGARTRFGESTGDRGMTDHPGSGGVKVARELRGLCTRRRRPRKRLSASLRAPPERPGSGDSQTSWRRGDGSHPRPT